MVDMGRFGSTVMSLELRVKQVEGILRFGGSPILGFKVEVHGNDLRILGFGLRARVPGSGLGVQGGSHLSRA